MTPHHHEPDHLPGEARPGTGLLRFALYAMLAWIATAALAVGVFYYVL